eukprot:symbB.v1.2.037870.t1/scaffold5715.1/size24294/1
MIADSYEGVRDVITFLALMNNHFGRSGGTDLSPLETSAGRPLSKPVTSMFGATVIAEIPDSIRQYSPNESRSIEAAYVHPGVGTGAAVEGWLRVDGRLELRRFYARNVREVAPISWNVDLCRSFLSVLDPRDDGGRQGDRAIAADDGQGAVAGPSRAVADERVDAPPSMNAPGIRHSAACKRRQTAEFSIPVEEPAGPPVFQPQPVVLPDAESQKSEALSRKRSSDVSVERLEEEIKQDGEHEPVDISSLIDGLWWHGHCCPMNGSLTLGFMPATAPDFFEADIASIKFRHGESGGSEVVSLCGKDVLLWKPLEAVDDSTLVALDPDLTVVGMREELENMSKCQVGVVLNQSELDQVKQECPHLRVIQARWVTAFKSAERVRARIVAKDFRTKDSARSLGCSSPTPDASLHWLQLLQQTIAAVGLWSDEQEPCAYQGHVFEGSTFLGTVMLLCYVDDLLLCSSTKLAEEKVVSVISGIVPTKTTSQILGAKQGGGMIQFIGCIIERFPHEDCLYLSVSPSYLDTMFRDYQIEKGSRSVPDVSIHLEKTDENSKRPLSPESYSRFRRALGRLLWLAQVRVDVKTWLSLLGSQQSAPTQATEAGLRAVLRFLKTDCHVVLRLPSRSEMLDFEKEAGSVYLHLWADASHAPYRFNKRKGISGQVMFFEKSLVRAVAKQRQATSLSSCEHELYSIQQAAQDAVSVSKVLERLLLGIGETAPETVVNVLLESDSASALQLIHGVDIPKKSRHIEIRLLWIRSQIEKGVVRMKHRAGSENVSDFFTKCLSSQLFFKHRETLGFEARSMPKLSDAGVTLIVDEGCLDVLAVLKSRPILLVELCCSEGSALNVETKRLGVRYVGALTPPMTEAEKVELARLLEKAKMDEDAERAQLASDIGYAKMSQDRTTWKPDSVDGSGSTAVVQPGQKGGNSMMSEGPMNSGGALFAAPGITQDGKPWHRNRKSLAMAAGGMSAAAAEPTYAGAMTDASKRRHEALDLSSGSDGFEMVDPEALLEEKLMLDEIAAMSQEMVPRLPVGHHGNPNQYPLGKRAGLNASVPLPAGTTEWDDTLCELPSVKDRFLSFAELRDCARSGDTSVRGLLNFCSTKFGDMAIEQLKSTGCCKKDGYDDIAAWLRRNCWDVCETNSGSTFKRTSKSSVVRAKGGGKGQCFIDLDPETTEDAPTKLVEDAGTPQQRRPRRSDITPMNPLRKAEVQLESFAFQPPAKRSKCENAGGSTASQAKNGPSEAPPASLRQHLERRQIQIEEQECKWKRAKAVPANRQVLEKQSLAFLLVSLEERLLLPVPGFEKGFQPGADNFGSASNPECRGSRPVLDLHGVNRDGASVLLHVHGFRPYFYAAKPPGEVNLEACLSTLDRAIRSDDGGVELLEEVERTPLMYYQANSEKFLRVVMSSTKLVNACRKELEKGILLPGGITWQSQAFEVVNIKERFLVDIAAAGGGWIEAQHGRFRFRPSSGCPMTSRAQLEADAHYSCLLGHSAEGEWLQLAPLRMLSLHLRTVGPEGRVCAGACVLRTHGKDDEHSVAWAVGGRQSAEAGAMQLVDSEAVLLEKLKDFILEVDPDIILGYDLLNSHLNSAISRAAALKIGAKGTLSLGRLNDVASRVKNATFETRQIGKHETKNINVDGRLLFDVLTVTEREHKLSSYTLSALALHFLGESRLELGASDLERLNAEEPRVLAQMARRDAGFAMRLFNNQHCLFRYVEMARVTGVPMEYLLQKGQSVKVVSMILRKARAFGYVLPPQTRSGNSLEEGSNTYEGGAVLEPDTGFYDEPVVALDFASLYPSIMQKHNLCYSTLLRSTSPAPQGDGDATVEEVPMLGHRFVTSKIRRGPVAARRERNRHGKLMGQSG